MLWRKVSGGVQESSKAYVPVREVGITLVHYNNVELKNVSDSLHICCQEQSNNTSFVRISRLIDIM